MPSTKVISVAAPFAFGVLTFGALAFGAFAQQPPVSGPPVPGPSVTSAQKQLEKQLKIYDPLDKTDPLLDSQKTDEEKAAEQKKLQQAKDGTAPAKNNQSSDSRPLPGSIADSKQSAAPVSHNQGPQVVADSGDAPVQEYSGPAVLSRSYTISRPMVAQQARFSVFAGYTESFDSGLTGPTVLPNGNLASGSGLGYSINWGVTGRHLWKFDQIGLSYGGSESKIGGPSGFVGTNQSLSVDYEHAFSRFLSLNVVTTGSTTSQGYGLQTSGLGLGDSASTSIANVNLSASPTVQILDQGTRQMSNQVSMTWRKSARLSFSAGGGMFFVQRGGGLYGNTGFQSQADVNYRLTRKTTIGAYYSFTDYSFSHRINEANYHTVGGIYSYALGRSAQIRLRGGVTRIENQGLQTVQIDPAIAALLGQTSGVIEAYHLNATSDISAQFIKDFGKRGTTSFAYVRGISPGNGLLLTSVQEGMTGSFSMRLLRKYDLSVSAGRSTLSSEAQTAGKYASQSFGAGLSRPISKHVGASFRVDYRTFNITGQPLEQHEFRVTSSLSWNPRDDWARPW